MVRSVVQNRVLTKHPSLCWVGTGGAGCARTPACSESGCGCQSPSPSIDPLDASRRTHAQQEQRVLGLCFSQSPVVFSKAMAQGPTSLANVGAGAFSTREGVVYSISYCEKWPLSCFSIEADCNFGIIRKNNSSYIWQPWKLLVLTHYGNTRHFPCKKSFCVPSILFPVRIIQYLLQVLGGWCYVIATQWIECCDPSPPC